MGFISHHEIEWRLTSDGMGAVIVGKFSRRDFVCPGTRVGPTEDPKVHFNLLVDAFGFTIRLEVVGSREGEIIVEEFAKLLGEGRGELWTMIRDNFVVKSKVEVYFVEEKSSYSFSSDRFLGRAENYPLCKAMVDHDQQGVKAGGGGEVSDEVTGDLLEGAGCMGLDQGEWGNGRVDIRLVLLACDIAFNILVDELREARPAKLRGNEPASLEISRVTGGLVIMAVGKDGVAEGILWGDIDTAFVD